MTDRSETTPGGTSVAVPGVSDVARLEADSFFEVYRGHETSSGRSVAVKVLPRPLDRGGRALFDRERTRLARLKHIPTILQLETVDTLADGRPYLISELCAESLDDRLRAEGPLPASEVYEIARDLTDALARAHEIGLVHGAVTPANVLFRRSGEVVLADFGTALRQAFGEEHLAANSSAAPETLRDGVLSTEADLYGLGAVLYTALIGRPPFPSRAGENPNERILRAMSEPAPVVDPALAGRDLSDLVAELLSTDPDDRPLDAAEVLDRLDRTELPAPAHRLAPPPAARTMPDALRAEPTRAEPTRAEPAAPALPPPLIAPRTAVPAPTPQDDPVRQDGPEPAAEQPASPPDERAAEAPAPTPDSWSAPTTAGRPVIPGVIAGPGAAPRPADPPAEPPVERTFVRETGRDRWVAAPWGSDRTPTAPVWGTETSAPAARNRHAADEDEFERVDRTDRRSVLNDRRDDEHTDESRARETVTAGRGVDRDAHTGTDHDTDYSAGHDDTDHDAERTDTEHTNSEHTDTEHTTSEHTDTEHDATYDEYGPRYAEPTLDDSPSGRREPARHRADDGYDDAGDTRVEPAAAYDTRARSTRSGSEPRLGPDGSTDWSGLLDDVLGDDTPRRAARDDEPAAATPSVSGRLIDRPNHRPAWSPAARRTAALAAVVIGIIVLMVVANLSLQAGGHDEQANPGPRSNAPTSAATTGPSLAVRLVAVQDRGTFVQVTWSGAAELLYNVVVAKSGEAKARVVPVQHARELRVTVARDVPYCFQIQATDGTNVVETKPRAIRGGICGNP